MSTETTSLPGPGGSHAPQGFTFAVRPLRLDWPDDLPRHWDGGTPFATHFMNALSVTFPHGEKFFIDAVRHYQDRIDDPALQREIRQFIGQEGWHRSVHQNFNDWLDRLGLPASRLDARTGRKIARLRSRLRPRGWLAATVCLEHFTALFAHALIADPERLDRMHPHFRRLWTWHAMEELEHKGVAFDVYRAIGGRRGPLSRAMLLVSLNFAWDITRNLLSLLRADGRLLSAATWLEGARFLFSPKQGLIWRSLPAC